MKQRFALTRTIVFTAAFAALCFVGTVGIAIPLPFGYANAGDIAVLLSGFCLGPWLGGIAAALGSALADLVLGYTIYAPATALIKFGVALLCALTFRIFCRMLSKKGARIAVRVVCCALGECVMLLGYFLYEWLLWGFGGAVATLTGNALQAVVAIVGTSLVLGALAPIRAIQRIFPSINP